MDGELVAEARQRRQRRQPRGVVLVEVQVEAVARQRRNIACATLRAGGGWLAHAAGTRCQMATRCPGGGRTAARDHDDDVEADAAEGAAGIGDPLDSTIRRGPGRAPPRAT